MRSIKLLTPTLMVNTCVSSNDKEKWKEEDERNLIIIDQEELV